MEIDGIKYRCPVDNGSLDHLIRCGDAQLHVRWAAVRKEVEFKYCACVCVCVCPWAQTKEKKHLGFFQHEPAAARKGEGAVERKKKSQERLFQFRLPPKLAGRCRNVNLQRVIVVRTDHDSDGRPCQTWFYWLLMASARLCWPSLRYIGIYWVLLDFNWLHLVLLGFDGFCWVLLDLNELNRSFHWLYQVFMGPLIGFIEFNSIFRIFRSFTQFFSVNTIIHLFCKERNSFLSNLDELHSIANWFCQILLE